MDTFFNHGYFLLLLRLLDINIIFLQQIRIFLFLIAGPVIYLDGNGSEYGYGHLDVSICVKILAASCFLLTYER